MLQVCSTIRAEFLPLLYAQCSVELHAHPYHHAWPYRRNGLAYTYEPSGNAPWALNFLHDLGSNIRFLGHVKVVQKLSGSHTVCHSSVWTGPLSILHENLRGLCNIEFEPEMDGLLSQDVASKLSQAISIDIAFWTNWSWDTQLHMHYLQVRVPNQKGPELLFEYQLEWTYREAWGLRYMEKLCDIHRAIWRVPGQRFFLY